MTGSQPPSSALSYELMQSYVISKGVLPRDLTDAVLDPLQFFRIPHLLALPTVAADQGDKLRQFMTLQPSDPALDVPTEALNVIMTYATLNPEQQAVTLSSIFARVRGMCKALADAVVTKDVTAGFSAASTTAYVKNIVNNLLVFVDSKLPLAPSSSSTVTTLDQHLTYVDTLMSQFVNEKVAADVQEWLVTPSLISKVRACMEPYYRLKFIGANVQGPWNELFVAADSRSFYDSRYSELVLYRCILTLYNRMLDILAANGDTTSQQARVLYSVRDGYRNAFDLKMAAASDAIAATHGKIATQSQRTRDTVLDLQKKHGDFQFRKGTLASLVQSVAGDERAYARQRMVFFAWVTAYVLIAMISIALLVTGRNAAFIFMSAILLLALVVYAFARTMVWVIKRV